VTLACLIRIITLSSGNDHDHHNDPLPSGSLAHSIGPLMIASLWGAATFLLARNGAFLQVDGGPPVRLMLAVVVPVALFLLAWRSLPAVGAWVRDLDLAVVTVIQTFRVLGIVFVFLFFLGQLPFVFAFAAGFGDVAVGIVALFATLGIAQAGKVGSFGPRAGDRRSPAFRTGLWHDHRFGHRRVPPACGGKNRSR